MKTLKILLLGELMHAWGRPSLNSLDKLYIAKIYHSELELKLISFS